MGKHKKPAWNKGIKIWWKSPTMFKKGQNALEKHPRWKGGITKIDKKVRRMPEYIQWRTNIFLRDSWTCQTCRARGIYVTVHHIKSFNKILSENKIKTIEEARDCNEIWDETNGVTLCEECHKLTDNYCGRGQTRNRKRNGANSVKLPTKRVDNAELNQS